MDEEEPITAERIKGLIDAHTLQMPNQKLPIELRDSDGKLLPDSHPLVLQKNIDWFKKESEILSRVADAEIKSVLIEKYNIITFETIYNETLSAINYYLDISDDNAHILALWIMGSHFHKEFSTFPILYLNAMRGSGKTRALNLISHLALGFKGNVDNSISESALFHSGGTALCIDEFEPTVTEKTRINILLNSCYKRGARVQRMVKAKKDGKESWTKEEHSLYMPVALANINGLDSVLSNRSIIIFLEKSFDQKITSRIEDYDKRLVPLKLKLQNMGDMMTTMTGVTDILDGWNAFIDSPDKDPGSIIIPSHLSDPSSRHYIYYAIYGSGISSRDLEICFPLLIMAALISTDAFANSLRVFSAMSKGRKESERDESHVLLLRFVSTLPEDNSLYSASELLEKLQKFSSVPTGFNAISLSLALERLCLVKEKRRTANSRLILLDITKAKQRIALFDKDIKDS